MWSVVSREEFRPRVLIRCCEKTELQHLNRKSPPPAHPLSLLSAPSAMTPLWPTPTPLPTSPKPKTVGASGPLGL